MKTRCLKRNHSNYYLYGARGIKIHKPWLKSFEAFIRDVGPAPSQTHTIDRIDPNGHYVPGNVRWATRREQMENRRDNHHVSVRGKKLCLAKAAREGGISPNTVHYRINHGWSEEDALTIPVAQKYRRKVAGPSTGRTLR